MTALSTPAHESDGSAHRGFDGCVVHLAAEYWPYARTGGLAEAVRGIARFQAASGGRTVVFMPLYAPVRAAFPEIEECGDSFSVDIAGRSESARVWRHPLPPNLPEVLFVESEYFDRPGIYGEDGGSYPDNPRRFALFCRAALHWLPRVTSGRLVLHAHDWHTALASIYLRNVLQGDAFFDGVSAVLTVHNAGYQSYHAGPGILTDLGLPPELYHWNAMEWHGQTNLLKGSLVFSDMVTTVSPTHAHELRTRAGGFGLHDSFQALQNRFVGILNGIDYEVWDPTNDPWIEAHFTRDDLSGKARCKQWLQGAVGLPVDPDVPIFGMTARLVEQKGIDLILQADMIPDLDAQWIFLGQGDPRYHRALGDLAAAFPDRISVEFDFTEEREHELLAGADFLLMPSQYEPCGLTQMRAQHYGALPVVRRVGGLNDTVEDRVTGFVFDEYQPWALAETVRYAIGLYRDRAAWEGHVREAMARDFGWARSVERYQDVYHRAAERRRAEA